MPKPSTKFIISLLLLSLPSLSLAYFPLSPSDLNTTTIVNPISYITTTPTIIKKNIVSSVTDTSRFVNRDFLNLQIETMYQVFSDSIDYLDTSRIIEANGQGFYNDNKLSNFISASSTMAHKGGNAYGDVFVWDGSGWTTMSTSTLINLGNLNSLSGTLAVSKGGTGQTSFGQGWLHSDGTTITSSTSPTVNYITATSTTATSTFRGDVLIGSLTGSNNRGFLIKANNASSLDFGFANSGSLNADPGGGGMRSIGQGSLLFGYSASQSMISSGNGSFSFGMSIGAFGGGSQIIATGTGSFAGGYVSGCFFCNIGLISAGGSGSFAFGSGGPSNPIISAGAGSFAGGSGGARAVATSSFVWGNAVSSNILSTSFGSGFTNSTASTFQVGYSAIPTLTVTSTKVGVSTTSPYAMLSVAGQVVGANFTATSTTATTTLQGTILTGSGGLVGIGTTTPSARLALTQSSNAVTGGFWLAGTDGDFRDMYISDTSGVLSFYGGDTGTLNTATLNAAGAWTNASDIAYKDNIVDLDTKYSLEDLMKIQPRFYTMKGTGKPQIGFIAQELKPILPEVVEGTDGSMGISYGNLVALTVEGIKNLSFKVDNILADVNHRLHTKVICIGDTCVEEQILREMLEGE